MKKNFICLLIVLLATQCRERYNVFTDQASSSLLVVEGNLSYGGNTSIRLSRTSILSDRTTIIEKNATVQVQGEDNAVFSLAEKDSGLYEASDLPLNTNTRYRLWIQTSNNKQYASEYNSVLLTPAIDSLSWNRNADGVQISVNAQGTEEQSRFYKWEYEEVWEFKSDSKTSWEWTSYVDSNSQFILGLKTQDTINPRFPEYNKNMYTCYKYHNSGAILLGNTTPLSANTVYYPIIFHEHAAWALSYLYSVNVKQRSISKEAYEFYSKMKKNTEQLGSVFDAQPVLLQGNIHCLTVPDELVIGYIESATIQQKRIFINNNQLPDWGYKAPCDGYESVEGGFLIDYYYNGWFVAVPGYLGEVVRYAFSKECIDCRTRGVNAKPDFWP